MADVTTEQRVNLWLSNADVYDYPTSLGSELIANGDFSSGASSWTLGTGWTIVGAECRATGPITDIDLTQALTTVIGDYYLVEFDIQNTSLTTWSLRMSLAGVDYKWTSGLPTQTEGARHYRAVIKAADTNGGITMRATIQGASYLAVDNISVKHVLTDSEFLSQMMEGVITPRQGSFDQYGFTVSPWSVSIG